MTVRVALLRDYPEEGWASMDLVAEMVRSHLGRDAGGGVSVASLCPPFRRRWPGRGAGRPHDADRLLNRFHDYPRYARGVARSGSFDVYHVIDHSYAQLVHALPAGRAVVTCHDLDAFRCLLDPSAEPRPAWFRAMAGRILSGLKKAAFVACDSDATRLGLESRGLVAAERLETLHLGVDPGFSDARDPDADAEAARHLGPAGEAPELLHVGTTAPRKRIDVLLEVFAGVRRAEPGARLVRVGGPFTPGQGRRAEALGVAGAIAHVPFVSRGAVAAIYRRSALVLLPSDAEGFGLPAAEALACGAVVLASDIPALREVGGPAASYRAAGDVPAWVDAASDLLRERRDDPGGRRRRVEAGIRRASRFRWGRHARRLAEIYGATAAAAGQSRVKT